VCQSVGVPELIIGARFNGPADSGNGGYTAGLVASCLPVAADQTAQVTLRVPPPLDTPLRVAPAGGGLEVYAGARLIAEAVPVRLDGDPPGFPVSYPEAAAATPGYPGFVDHPFPTCYVCGPEPTAGAVPGRCPTAGPPRPGWCRRGARRPPSGRPWTAPAVGRS
jgi:hypothetical protein